MYRLKIVLKVMALGLINPHRLLLCVGNIAVSALYWIWEMTERLARNSRTLLSKLDDRWPFFGDRLCESIRKDIKAIEARKGATDE